MNARLVLASAIFAAIIGVSPSSAAPSDENQPRPQIATGFVDLTGAPTSNLNTKLPNGPAGMNFVDLTNGGQVSAPPDRNGAFRPTLRRFKVVDLSNGAALPDFDQMEEIPELAPDIVTITADRLNDPFEETNRARFRGHVRLHHYVIDPVERVYIYVVPLPARDGVHNVLSNLETPAILANDVLQGDIDRAGNTLSRFVVNTTLGLGGLFDIAGRAGIPFRDDDFGATLATYGVSERPYLLVPVIGPSNPRDLSGKVVDFFLNPFRYFALPGGFVTSATHAGFHELDKRQDDVGRLDELSRIARDPYATERAAARASRNAEIFDTPAPP